VTDDLVDTRSRRTGVGARPMRHAESGTRAALTREGSDE
jgi:hypothetical protein